MFLLPALSARFLLVTQRKTKRAHWQPEQYTRLPLDLPPSGEGLRLCRRSAASSLPCAERVGAPIRRSSGVWIKEPDGRIDSEVAVRLPSLWRLRTPSREGIAKRKMPRCRPRSTYRSAYGRSSHTAIFSWTASGVQLVGISAWYINRKSALVLLGTKTFSKVGPQLRYLSILLCP